MNLYVPVWLVLMVAGYLAGRIVESVIKLIRHLDRETRGPFNKK